MRITVLLLIALMMGGCAKDKAVIDYGECYLASEYKGYPGVWLIYEEQGTVQASNLEYYRDGMRIKDIVK